MTERKRILGILCVLMTTGLLFVGFWPFDLSPKNRAYWLPNEEGLHFDGQNRRWKRSVGGIAYTPSPLSSPKPAPSIRGAFTIEIALRPGREVKSGVPHILGFVDSSGREAFYLGQWKNSLIVRWFTFGQTGKRRMKEIGVRDALPKDKIQRLTLVSKPTTCSIYVNGELAKSFEDVSLISQRETIRGYSVVVGNSKAAKGPWTGNVLVLKVYERALGETELAQDLSTPADSGSHDGLVAYYALDKGHSTAVPDISGNKNMLAVPDRVTFTNSILAWPDWRNQKDSSPVGDIAVNILGFVPFGFLFAFWRDQVNGSKCWRSIFLAVFAGAMISLLIEVAQAFIPARDSNMVDVICNTSGTAIGVGLQMARKWESSKVKAQGN